MHHADKLAFQSARATNTNIDIPHPITTMDDDGIQHDLTFEELDAFSRFPFSEGQLVLAMMTAEVKFSPRYAKVFIRTKRLYMLDEDLEIIDLTTDVGTGSNFERVHTVLNAAEEAQARLRRARFALSHCRLSTVSMHTT